MSRSPSHRARMAARRERQLARTPGFEPMPNRRIVAAVVARAGELQNNGIDAIRAFEFAWTAIAQLLPPLTSGRHHRAPKPSKSDCPKYRKAITA